MNRILTTLATLALMSLLLASAALAHAKVASSNPAPGQTLTTSPATVAITFSEDLTTGSTGAVTDAAGTTVSTGAAVGTTDRTQMSIALKANLPNGVYKVSWHSVAADDNGMLDGTFYFGVGVAAPSTATLPTSTNTGLAFALLGLATILGLVSTRALRRGKA
jgi:methionine-rich copper-binding protein CopC